jgi:hypothetical protein
MPGLDGCAGAVALPAASFRKSSDSPGTWPTCFPRVRRQLPWGVSERTIRNWISSGKLLAERTPAGFRVRTEDLGNVPRSTEVRTEHSGNNGTLPEASADLSALVDLLRELLPKAEAAAMWQARAEMLSAQLELAQLALAAPKEADTSPGFTTAPPDNVAVETPQKSSEARNGRPRAWWRWW